MFNKKEIKDMFAEEFDSQKMKQQILQKYENKGENKMFQVLKYALPICLIVISGILLFNNKSQLKQDDKTNSINIVVNKIPKASTTKFDADIKEVSFDNSNLPNILNDDLIIPSDLNKSTYHGIYTKGDQDDDYNVLNCYVYNYYNEIDNKNIRIAFSNENKPIRDYHFSENGSTKSRINEHDLIIYQYAETYFVEFSYKDYNFDIETNNITLEELTLLLTSIIK